MTPKKAPGTTGHSFLPAPRVLALIMGVSLLVLGIAGLAFHQLDLPGWILGEHIGIDVFHLVMAVLAIGAARSPRSAKGFGGFALVVFIVAAVVAAAAPMLAHEEQAVAGLPTWLTENTIGFSGVNYIVFFLMALWGLLLALTSVDVDPWGSGDAHASLRAMPDREILIESDRRAVGQAASAD
ncbi:MAG: hypothetical protein GEV10_02925 [Streptosporangiales bacterium]|nr:hypothetical protein [Streptosporangiales bacterium]